MEILKLQRNLQL
jgi:glutaminase